MMKQSGSLSMGKIWVEVCLISARGLPRSSLWKYQWYAVGWIDPNNKYCTKIDASGNANPVWKTKFTTVIDPSESEFQDMALHVEVYSREPVFLREKHQGSATVILREFLAKHCKNSEGSNQGNEDVGSFQLRKKNSNKPQGFIDVSIRISEEKEGTSSHFFLGNEDGFNLRDSSSNFNMPSNGGPYQAQPAGQAELPFHQPGNPRPPVTIRNRPYNHPMPHQINHSNSAVAGPSYPPASSSNYPTNYSNPHAGRPSYPPTRTPGYPPPPPHAPPPMPPSSHTGYVPTFLPRTNDPSTSYVNMPSGAGRGVGPGFGVGLGAGALAAGAVIFGDDIMSGYDIPTAGIRDATFAFATDPF
ncbi:protein SRC2 homolog [Chenopodium quinoa]|uniref:C2 domain-containing protein n=1 Tax=Chenopodium quinoa TaxID=63459 RepID=A0A803MMQ1_CHEQI|nr:protein SRC2 homolog [Chenopodium quinoa]